MQLFQSFLCLAVLLAVANSAPMFEFGTDVLEGINDDAQGEWSASLYSENVHKVVLS